MSQESLSNADLLRHFREEMASLKALLLPDGFVEIGAPVVVFCNMVAGNKAGWYRLEGSGNEQRAITLPPKFFGYVDWLRAFRSDPSNDTTRKFRLYMKTRHGQKYFFEAGWDSFFTKTTVAFLSQADPSYLRHPICITSWDNEIKEGPNKGRHTVAVAYSLPQFSYKFPAKWDNSSPFGQMLLAADSNIQAATGKVRQGDLDSYE